MPRGSQKRKGRKTLRGGFYSFDGAVGTGAPSWGRGSEMGEFVVDKTGNIGDMRRGSQPVQYGRGRRRGKKGRRTRRKTLRGGGGTKYGAVSASYTGTGERGVANYVGTNTKFPPFGGPAQGAFNNAGAQPGSGFGSFNILPK
jgi:hypothetical protein